MKNLVIFTICYWLSSTGYSQGYQNTILFGYDGGDASPNNDEYGANILTFTNGSLEIKDNQNIDAFFNDTDAAISDDSGQLLFYFNGIDVFDKSHEVMQNGNLLNEYSETGYDLPQGGIIVPYPEKESKYILFHVEEGYVELPGWGLEGVGIYYSVIDMTLNNGFGRVVQKKIPLLIDTIEYGKLTMTRHANGRDWWLAVPESHSNRFFMFLIDPYGVHYMGDQAIGVIRVQGYGQSSFSPDGSKYVMFATIGVGGNYQYLDIYDFDRCGGLFNNHQQIHLIGSVGGGGVAISPNSRWLYVPSHYNLYKFDLWADSVKSTQQLIAEYAPFNDPFPTNFHTSFLAPDNKVYIITTSGSRTLHVIHKPDESGLECAFEQHGIRLPCYNNNSLPTFANFRLGPIDGSSCDTLGVNNEPISWWRYTQDTTNSLLVEFTDLSYYEPVSWSWDFGDGSTGSNERHPTHQFDSAGIYQVCLTVSNANGAKGHCNTLYLGVSAQQNPILQNRIRTMPNPFNERLLVEMNVTLRRPVFRLYDLMGRIVREERIVLGLNEIETGDLAAGMYFWEAFSGNECIKSGKLIKIDE